MQYTECYLFFWVKNTDFAEFSDDINSSLNDSACSC